MSDPTLQDADEIPDNEQRQFRLPMTMIGERLDKVLATLIPEHSRSRLQGWIEEGHVLVNGVPGKIRQNVGADDLLVVTMQQAPEQTAFTPEPVDFMVVADSPDWIVVNKPAGLVTHPGAGNWSGTLLNGLLYRYPELAHVPRAGIVHRLDKDTDGLLVVARNEAAQTHFVRQLQTRSMGREYEALVMGHCPASGTVTLPIGRDRHVPVRMSTVTPIAPKEAITHYERQGFGHIDDAPVSHVRCRLETGRTHQIRVHMHVLGHPLLGDTLYNGKSLGQAQRQMLHARRLTFIDPATDQPRSFDAARPDDMEQVMAAIEWTAQ
mgnify:CR=1 FL=1